MLLGMELFLLVRHTHTLLLEQKRKTFTQPQSYWWRTDGGLVQRQGGGGFGSGGGVGGGASLPDHGGLLPRSSQSV